MDSAAMYTLILLPKSRNTKLWRYFGFCSDDGTLITKGHESIKVRGPAAADDHPLAVSNVGGRPGGQHPELQRTP